MHHNNDLLPTILVTPMDVWSMFCVQQHIPLYVSCLVQQNLLPKYQLLTELAIQSIFSKYGSLGFRHLSNKCWELYCFKKTAMLLDPLRALFPQNLWLNNVNKLYTKKHIRI